MANVNCGACEDLRQTDPNLIVNGFTETECASLQNDTGLVPSSGHDDCTDLNNLNDCLVGNMENEVEAYDVCDWKSFMKKFIPNVWTTLKAIICAICGLWTRVTCLYDSLVNLINYLAGTTSGIAFVRQFRNLGTGDDVPYWENISEGFTRTLDIYMDSAGSSSGSKAADRDYVVMISNCTNFVGFNDLRSILTFYSSGDSRSITAIRNALGQHPSMNMKSENVSNFSWTTSGAVLLKKGEHIKVEFHATSVEKGDTTIDGAPKVRVHQFILTWIPVNVSEAIDPSDILTC